MVSRVGSGLRARCLVAAASVVLATLTGCSAGSPDRSDSSPDRSVVDADTTAPAVRPAHAEEVFPFSTLREMRTFTDSWVHVRAVEERFGPTEGDGDEEGYRPRWVTFEVIDRVWQRKGAEVVPGTFERQVLGDAVSGGEGQPLSSGGSLVQVDRQYLVGLVDFGEVTAPAAGRAVILVEDGRVVVPAEETGGAGQDELASLDGMPVGEAVARIAAAEPLVPDEVGDPMRRLEVWQRSR